MQAISSRKEMCSNRRFTLHKGALGIASKPAEQNATDKKTPSIFMRNIKRDYVRHETGPFSRPSAGKTPLSIEVADGNYIVAVQFDANDHNTVSELAAQNKKNSGLELERIMEGMFDNMEVQDSFPKGEVGFSDSGTGYLNDANRELWAIITDGLVRKIGKTYKVEKKNGATATVIALFQHKDEEPQKLYAKLPDDYKFRNRMFLDASTLEMFGVPKAECEEFYERLAKGGKAVYISNGKYVMCEFTPLDHDKPNKRRTGGFKMGFLMDLMERK